MCRHRLFTYEKDLIKMKQLTGYLCFVDSVSILWIYVSHIYIIRKVYE